MEGLQFCVLFVEPACGELDIVVTTSVRCVLWVLVQCFAEKFHNWGQCPRALEKVGTFEEKVGTFEKKVGTLWGK